MGDLESYLVHKRDNLPDQHYATPIVTQIGRTRESIHPSIEKAVEPNICEGRLMDKGCNQSQS